VFVQDELLVNFAAGVGAKYIIRGLRGLADFEKEYEMCQINRLINPEVQTLYLIAPPEFAQVSSSTVRELAIFKGSDEALKKFAHEIVIQAVRDKIESKRAKQQG
jgi:pantetheine-phosphate adenylyltransferase